MIKVAFRKLPVLFSTSNTYEVTPSAAVQMCSVQINNNKHLPLLNTISKIFKVNYAREKRKALNRICVGVCWEESVLARVVIFQS